MSIVHKYFTRMGRHDIKPTRSPLVKVPRVKLIAPMIQSMFINGLPTSWGNFGKMTNIEKIKVTDL